MLCENCSKELTEETSYPYWDKGKPIDVCWDCISEIMEGDDETRRSNG